MGAIVQETTYDAVVYQGRVGTLKLSDENLTFQTKEKISVLPWEKVVKRQVSTANSNTTLHMFKLILQSGNEAIFQAQDRVSLEVMRDDLGDRLKTYRKFLKAAEEKKQQEVNHSAAINKTRRVSRRESTPYRFVNAGPTTASCPPPKSSSRRASMAGPATSSSRRRSSTASAPSSSSSPRRSSVAGATTPSPSMRRSSVAARPTKTSARPSSSSRRASTGMNSSKTSNGSRSSSQYSNGSRQSQYSSNTRRTY